MKHDFCLKHQHRHSFAVFGRHLCVFIKSSRPYQTLRSEKNLPVIQVSVHKTLRRQENVIYSFIAIGVTSLSFSNCTVELGLRLAVLYIITVRREDRCRMQLRVRSRRAYGGFRSRACCHVNYFQLLSGRDVCLGDVSPLLLFLAAKCQQSQIFYMFKKSLCTM